MSSIQDESINLPTAIKVSGPNGAQVNINVIQKVENHEKINIESLGDRIARTL